MEKHKTYLSMTVAEVIRDGDGGNSNEDTEVGINLFITFQEGGKMARALHYIIKNRASSRSHLDGARFR